MVPTHLENVYGESRHPIDVEWDTTSTRKWKEIAESTLASSDKGEPAEEPVEYSSHSFFFFFFFFELLFIVIRWSLQHIYVLQGHGMGEKECSPKINISK
jgi:hypothetical protein